MATALATAGLSSTTTRKKVTATRPVGLLMSGTATAATSTGTLTRSTGLKVGTDKIVVDTSATTADGITFPTGTTTGGSGTVVYPTGTTTGAATPATKNVPWGTVVIIGAVIAAIIGAYFLLKK